MRNRIDNIIKNVDREGYKVTGSYSTDDCIFLLKDLTDTIVEISVEEKERLIKEGINYSEILSVEKPISDEYNRLFRELLDLSAKDMAKYIGIMSERIYKEKGEDVVLVSLARAGTPFGILAKDYLEFVYGIKVPHYSVSIIRGKGIDENAILYILENHPNGKIQFVDGWTGKGSITFELAKAMNDFYDKYGIRIDDSLAVVADPAKISSICGTREDILIPNCCLNSTVSGLTSRTYHNGNEIGEYDFHGAKVYKNLEYQDFSQCLLNRIRLEFEKQIDNKELTVKNEFENYGEKILKQIAKEFEVKDLNKIKLSIGESSRVLLRRIPRCVLVKNMDNPHIKYLIAMAKDKNVPIIPYDKSDYEVISIIKE